MVVGLEWRWFSRGMYMRLLTAILLLSPGLMAAQDARTWLNQGVAAFKNAQYAEAVAAFEKAVNLAPGDTTARLYLGTAYMQQYIPGAQSPENLAMAQRAEAEF